MKRPLVALALVTLGLGPSLAYAGYTEFTSITSPIGVACVGDGAGGITDRLLVTSYYNSGSTGVYSVNEAGVATGLTITGLPTWSGIEVYLAVSPGLGDWETSIVYLVKGDTIYKLSADLSAATVFATIAGAPNTHSGITFDRTGVWNHDMIVTNNNGNVWRVSPTGAVTYVATTGTFHEAPRVITDDPAKWGAYAGCISTSAENAHKVFAICPGGAVSTLASSLINAETSDLRPTTGETPFGSTEYVYFLSAFNYNRVVAYKASDLPIGSEGDLFVSRESSGGIYQVSGISAATTFAAAGSEHYEGSNFCFSAGTIDTAEVCDDDIDNDGDGLIDENDTDCHVCGDGDVDPGETCDDGNLVYGDGCDGTCTLEDTCNDTDGDGVCADDDVCPGFDDADDADHDGTPDGCDDCDNDPLDDADHDGVCGDLDECPGFDDTLDDDGDGLPNGCDACPNDAANDADGDGVCGNVDACPGSDDTEDADGDAIPDDCDECPLDPDNDADGDGVCGDVDICEGSDDNADVDLDGIPDGCDACPNDADNDADGDGVCGDVDTCEGHDDNADADGDDLPDACDACPDDADNDADGDGICGDVDACPGTGPDTVPTERLGTNRWADIDGDGDFDTVSSGGRGPGRAYTMEDTDGCSCGQIIATCGYGSGHTKFGCSISVMDAWVDGNQCH